MLVPLRLLVVCAFVSSSSCLAASSATPKEPNDLRPQPADGFRGIGYMNQPTKDEDRYKFMRSRMGPAGDDQPPIPATLVFAAVAPGFCFCTRYVKGERTLSGKTSTDGKNWTTPQLVAHFPVPCTRAL